MRMNRQRWCALLALAIAAVAVGSAQEHERRGRREREGARPRAERRERDQPTPGEIAVEEVSPPKKPPRPLEHVSLVQLQHADVRSLAGVVMAMQRAFSGPVVVSPDMQSHTLVVAAETKETIDRIESLVQALDQPERRETRYAEQFRVIRLKTADATTVARHLDDMLPQSWRKVRIAPDPWANAVWLAGYPSMLDPLERVIEGLEESAAAPKQAKPEGEVAWYVYNIQHADAGSLAEVLNHVAEGGMKVTLEPESNTLLLMGTPEELERLKQIIARLDQPPRPTKPALRRGDPPAQP